MKKDNRTASQQSDLTLMNARRKEKLIRLRGARKPSLPSEWVALSEALVDWAMTTQAVDIDDYARTFHYPPHQFKKWTKESEIFADALERAIYLVAGRRNKMFQRSDALLLRTLPLYDLSLAEHEKTQEQELSTNKGNVTIVYAESRKTPAGDEWEKKGKE